MEIPAKNEVEQSNVPEKTPVKRDVVGLGVFSSQRKTKQSKATENFNRDFKAVPIATETPETSKYYWDPGQLFQNQFIRSQSSAILGALTDERTLELIENKQNDVSEDAQMTHTLLSAQKTLGAHSQGQAIRQVNSLDLAGRPNLDPTWCKKEYLKLKEQAPIRKNSAQQEATPQRGEDLGKRDQVYLSVPRFLTSDTNKPGTKKHVCESLVKMLPDVISLINHSVASHKLKLENNSAQPITEAGTAQKLSEQGASFFADLGAELCSVIGIFVDQRLSTKNN